MTPSSLLRAYLAHDLGGDLHRLAQRAAVVAAAVYVAGMAAGVVIHWANDWLSGNRRPWPITCGAVAKPDPLHPLSATVSPGWIVYYHCSFVDDFSSWYVTELRAMAKAKGRVRVYSASARGFIPISQASKSELIAELE
jgi:hypothetical protein